MGSPNGIPWIVGIFLLLAFNSDISHAQRQQSRLTSSRAFGINPKNTNSGSEFECPEEFGYYPHPSDCTQYYVCVFGGALLESCTGGLMYSHELQTCDWPRNVGCEVVEGASQQAETIAQTQPGRDITSRISQVKSQSQQLQQQPQQAQQQRIAQQTTAGPQRVRFQTPIVTTVAPQQLQQLPIVQQPSQQQQSQRTLSRQKSIPQPEFPAPNPIITSRGQPKSLLESQEDIAKLYAEAHDTLPPAEEEESDRQQRVYRGQPSTLGQVQRDRDGIIHHANVNALPNHGKIGSFAFGSQISQFSDELQDLDADKFRSHKKHLGRKRRDVDTHKTTETTVESTLDSHVKLEQVTEQTNLVDGTTDTDATSNEESNTTEYVRSSRQLRGSKFHSSWHFQPNVHLLPHLTAKSFRAGFPPNIFNPFLAPPEVQASHLYKPNHNLFSGNVKLSNERAPSYNPNPSKIPPFDFKPSTFFGYSHSGQVSDTSVEYNGFHPSTTVNSFHPAILERFQQKQSQRNKDRLPDTFSYFHIGQTATSTARYETPSPVLSPPYRVTPKGQFASGSTVGGFYNNNNGNSGVTSNAKKVPHFNTQEPFSTTQSNYFAYNILQNQKMKQYYITTTPMTPIISTQLPVTNTENDFHAISSPGYYPKELVQKQPPLSTVFKYKISEDKFVGSSAKTNSFPGKIATTTTPPVTKVKVIPTKKPLFQMPVAGGSFDFERFVAGIRESHIAQVDPSIMDTLNFFKYNLLRKNQTSSEKPTIVNEVKEHRPHASSSSTVRPIYDNEYKTYIAPTTKIPKGYESFINSIPSKSKPENTVQERPNQTVSNESQAGLAVSSGEYYYDDEDGDFDYDVIPPSEKPPYMPMSETMAPKLPRPTSSTTLQSQKVTRNRLPSNDDVTTATYSFSLVDPTDDPEQKQKIPSFINFPPDIFQRIPAMSSIRQKLKNLTLGYSTPEASGQTRPWTLKTTSTTGLTTTTSPPVTTRTTTTAATTTRKIYTIRPRTRPVSKLKPNKLTNILKRPEQQQILKEAKYKYSTTPQPSNIFVQQPQQQRPKPVAEPQNTRNTYYNTSNQAYDPATYDSFYSVYDDDVELYRDLEYNNQQQQQSQPQYNSGQRNRQQPTVQPTYRPEIITTPTPQIPTRETYVNKQQPQQQNTHQQSQDSGYSSPSLNYNTEYDDALISQIDNQAFNQPARNPPARGDRNDLNSISDSYSSIRTTNPTRFAPIFQPPSTTTTTTATTRYRSTTTLPTAPPTTPSTTTTTTTTTYRPPTIRTTQSTTTTTTTTTTATPLPITTTSSTTSTTTTTTDQTTTKSARSTRMQDNGESSNKTAESETIVVSLTAAVSPRNQSTTTTTTTTTTKRTTQIATSTATSTQGKLYDTNRSENIESSPKYVVIPSHVRNVQILNESPISESTEPQLTEDSLTQPQPKLSNQNDNDSRISLSLSRGFSTVAPNSPFDSSSTSITPGRKPFFGFQVADEQPQGFKLPSSSSAGKISSVIVIPQEELESEKNFEFSLSSGVGLNDKAASFTRGSVEEIPIPIYSRTKEESVKQDTTKVIVDPTTYSPTHHWRFAKTSPSSFPNQEYHNIREFSDNKEAHSQYSFRRAHINGLEANKDDRDSSEINEKFQGFTAKALIFKDSLNKNSDSASSSRFVSPFKSLETLLAEKEKESFKKSISRVNLNASNDEVEQTTTQKPFRSYFLITQPPKPSTSTTTTTTPAATTQPFVYPTKPSTTTTTSTVATTIATEAVITSTSETPIKSTAVIFHQTRKSVVNPTFRGRSRYTFNYNENYLDNDEPTTYSPKHRFSTPGYAHTTPNPYRLIRTRPINGFRGFASRTSSAGGRSRFEFSALRAEEPQKIDRESYPTQTRNKNVALTEESLTRTSISTEQKLVEVTERPSQFFSNYRNLATERLLAESIRHESEPVRQQQVEDADQDREKFRATVEMPEFNIPTEKEIQSANDAEEASESPRNQQDAGRVFVSDLKVPNIEDYYESDADSAQVTQKPVGFSTRAYKAEETTTTTLTPPTTQTFATSTPLTFSTSTLPSPTPFEIVSASSTLIYDESDDLTTPLTTTSTTTSTTPRPTTTRRTTTTSFPLPARASRVNNSIKSSIAASSRKKVSSSAFAKCSDSTPNAKCNEIPSRTRNRGGVTYNSGLSSQQTNDRETSSSSGSTNRGTHPPRTRPTLKSKGTIVSKAAEFIDIYKNPPSRPEPLYPQPTPDKTAAKCRKDVCLLPDCSCGGKDIPGDLPVETLPQIVLLTFDDSINDLNKQLYTDLFEKGRVNPNGCPITATFYVSHEWTDYSQVQNLYSDGHEMASHTVSHSFGEQFSQKKWTREIAGQREILAAYGGVKLSDVRGMRAPFLSVGGNKMFKMLYDSNFTYDSSMPVYENRPPSWPYTLDYKLFHDCMIPPCPTKSYPGVWEVPMVMWQDLNGGRCSMGDACANPPEAENVTKMLMKNFDRHYTTNRAPFGLFYHAAWFTQPHHKAGFIKFLDTINAMDDVWIVTNWQMLQWVRDPTPLSRIKQFQPFQCDYSDRPKRCNNPKVCNLWHKSGVRYMRTCQPCPDIYPWTGKTGIRSSRIDNDIEE